MVYRYTCEYLYIKGKKYYVSKKHRYPKRPRPGTDENDPENPDNRRLLARWLELRTEIRRKLRERKKLVTLYCGVLNAMKPRRLARLEPAAVLEEAWEAYRRSEEYAGLSAELDGSRARRHSEPEEGRYPYQNEIYGGCGERVRSKNELIAAVVRAGKRAELHAGAVLPGLEPVRGLWAAGRGKGNSGRNWRDADKAGV